MKPVVVRVTLDVTVIAPDAPTGGHAVTKAVQRALAATPSNLLAGASWQMMAFDKPTED